jgi:hypothetical protein
MTNRALRAILLLLAMAATGAAGYSIFSLEQRARAERLAQQTARDRVKSVLSALSEIRASHRSYVAVGQGHRFWTARVTNLLVGLEASLRDLRITLRSEAAASALDTAAVALDNFTKLDTRAQEYVNLNQNLLAADLIFSDGLEMTAMAAAQIDAALTEELKAHEQALAALHRQQAWMAAGAGGFLLIILLLLAPMPRGEIAADENAPAEAEMTTAAMASSDDDLVLQGPVAEVEPQPDLPGTALLCTEFGRVMETREVPPLLARAAEILDAAGLVVWVSDRAAVELRPVLSHGYSEKLVAQMHSIPRDAPNAAALAFRSAQLRIVAGTQLTNGAVVVPLITPAGCVGVLAAELKHGGEQREATRALATILAAQLSTLVGAAPSAGAAHAQA